MVFNGIANQKVEFKIHNYEFPNTLDRDYDGNWLLVYLKVQSSVGNWQTINPSLLTWELKSLIEWFDLLSEDKKPEFFSQEFIEPNISFHLLSEFNAEEKLIKIKFDLESRPKSAKDDIEYYVITKVDAEELKQIVTELKNELKMFPERQ